MVAAAAVVNVPAKGQPGEEMDQIKTNQALQIALQPSF